MPPIAPTLWGVAWYSSRVKKRRVLVAMSGGVDSSVAAARLFDAGFDVVGCTLHLWDYPEAGPGSVFFNEGGTVSSLQSP